MRIYVRAKPRSARNEVVKISESLFEVKVTAVPEKGKANEAVVAALSKYFNVPKSSVKIIAGKSAKTKILDIE